MVDIECVKEKVETQKCERDLINYLLKIHDSIQDMVVKTEDRSIGATNITVIASVLVMIVSKYGYSTSMYYVLFPVGSLIVLSLYTYNNRVSAILRGYLAGIEDILAQKIGKNIFIFNRGYNVLYHIPHFITNDIMGVMFAIIGLLLTVYSFYKIIEESILPCAATIIYIIIYMFFAIIFAYELYTNGTIKDKARKYFHIAYENNIKDYTFEAFDFKKHINNNDINIFVDD